MKQRSQHEMSIEQVQQWVITALICAVSSFPIGVLIVVTHQTHERDPNRATLLCVMIGAIGISAMMAIRLIHRQSPCSVFLVLGILPALASATWTFGF